MSTSNQQHKRPAGSRRRPLAMAAAAVLSINLPHAADAQPAPAPVVRLAELEIDPAQLEAYKAAVKEEIETSVRIEPGVLSIQAVALRDKPNHLRFFEVYADDAAYRQHIQSPHFRKYVETTKAMILSRQLMEADQVVLGFKPR